MELALLLMKFIMLYVIIASLITMYSTASCMQDH